MPSMPEKFKQSTHLITINGRRTDYIAKKQHIQIRNQFRKRVA